MANRDEILALIKTLMFELFEIEEDTVTLEMRLYEDLDFDSIDAIDMIVKLEKETGKSMKPEDFKSARTVNDVVEAVFNRVST
ncbi:MAG: acyl carrier protein [Methylococcales symbiont of Hymedesmia sp. n. MRB-2018]|nr:MAG: acyl carrier protein [Methylococcales symbiont of Hymedesmia sp. n. MRB-2018]KAF3984216.1 MAG: acyl carrier protein [Methylococcales symbiont of Hymedesmia sp. n. MRB-2018]